MSFLNSVLNNIGKDGQQTTPIVAPPHAKRKAEDELAGPNGKASKVAMHPHSSAPTNVAGDRARANHTKPQPIIQRGTDVGTTSSAPATPIAENPKQPKKGSYQEIMARAKAQKDGPRPPPVGLISHKPKDKIELSHKQEKKMKKAAARDKKLGIIGNGSRPSSSDRSRANSLGPGGKAFDGKKSQQVYSGTAKPIAKPEHRQRLQSSYKGTMGLKTDATKRAQKTKPRRNANEYAGTDDELDSGDEDEGNAYGGSDDESDDMEAGFSDVEQEETRALKVARKEDEEQLQLENELKRQKESRRADMERKSKLSALAAKQKSRQY